RSPPGSFQNMTGIDGIGAVRTSSPTSPTTGLPSGSKDSTFAPRDRHGMTPALIGWSGVAPTHPVHASVPPENDPTGTPGSCSATQANPSGGSGDPVEPTPRSRSSPSGTIPAFIEAMMYGAPVPKYVTPSAAAIRQSTAGDGYPAEPSYSTGVAPTSSAPTR